MRFINRWSLMRNTETENIQEHSLEVAMVAHNLAALKNEYFGGNVDINKVAVIAMYHEVSEIFTGDMPTPIKYFDPKLRELYGEVETLAQEKMLSTLPERLQGVYKPFIVDQDGIISRVTGAQEKRGTWWFYLDNSEIPIILGHINPQYRIILYSKNLIGCEIELFNDKFIPLERFSK